MPFPDEPSAHRVKVWAYREGRAAEAASYVELVRAAVPAATAVDHIGSTSVPGLPAKDCLDLMVQVTELDEAAVVPALSAHGFRLRPEPWNRDEVTDGVSHPKLVFAGPAGGRAVRRSSTSWTTGRSRRRCNHCSCSVPSSGPPRSVGGYP